MKVPHPHFALRPSMNPNRPVQFPRRQADEYVVRVRRCRDDDIAGDPNPGVVEHDYPRMRIVALKRGLEEITVAPEPQTQFQSDDLVIAVGAEESLKRFAEMAA